MSELDKANEYVKSNHVPEGELPLFHVAPPVGWMNDPNGFSAYKGKIHLFYQYHPYSEVWGPMHWGHYVSEDLVKWEELPVAMAPDSPFDEDGCFSGSAIETPMGHVLAYTGVAGGLQNQCIAVGDGHSYMKLSDNPAVTGDMLPEGFSRKDFRDPKIWKEPDGYYMVAGNRTDAGVPQAVLFHSEDLRTWEYVSVLAKDESGRYGSMWECPDFFCLDGQYVLMASPQDMQADEEFHNGNNSVYFMGEYDREKHKFNYTHVYSLDDGLDFYAPQTMEMTDGRRILIGWMQSWDSNIRPAGQKWSCMMTLPRELGIKNGRIIQSPVRELKKYRREQARYDGIGISGKCELPGINGRILDMTVEICGGDYGEFRILFAQNEKYCTSLVYNRKKNELELDRTFCKMTHDTTAIRKVKVKNSETVRKIRMILDKYSAEIFINDGKQVLSTTYYTPMDASRISFECTGTAMVNIDKYTISLD